MTWHNLEMDIEFIILKEDTAELRAYTKNLSSSLDKQSTTYYTTKSLLKKLLADTKWDVLVQMYELGKFKTEHYVSPSGQIYEQAFGILNLIPIPAIKLKLKYLEKEGRLIITDFMLLKNIIS